MLWSEMYIYENRHLIWKLSVMLHLWQIFAVVVVCTQLKPSIWNVWLPHGSIPWSIINKLQINKNVSNVIRMPVTSLTSEGKLLPWIFLREGYHQMAREAYTCAKAKCGNKFAYLLLARRELFLPMPKHFSRCGANLEAAKFLWQFGHTHSNCFFIGTCPNTSNPGSATISKNKSEISSIKILEEKLN